MEADAAPATGSFELALAHATRLLAGQPALAAEQAREILKVVPGSGPAMLVLARALQAQGDGTAARQVLLDLTRSQPGYPDGWRELADHFDASGDEQGADRARAAFLGTAVRDPRLRSAAAALQANEIPVAEGLLRAHLLEHPSDVAALRMLAEVAARLRRYVDAQLLLERCLELAPSFRPALHQYAIVLFRQAKATEARGHVETLLAEDPANLGYQTLRAAILAHLGETSEALQAYERILRRARGQAKIVLSYGHALKTAGRGADCIAAYREAIRLLPTLGDAWWSLANLKTFGFADEDVAQLRGALGRLDLSDEDRLHFEFALGKALEDRKEYEESFRHYEAGAAIRRRMSPYRADETHAHVERSRATYTKEIFARLAGAGNPDPDPIFILGMPRSGSTLLEQILASHPLVEGTMELPNIATYAWELADLRRGEGRKYPDCVAGMTAPALRELGERYLRETRVQRKTSAPFFIDKLPNNFLHVGLIHLILPRARIIDSRRHPMACCFSNFKQHFARGQNFSYSLDDVGRFYRDYVDLMAHFDAVLPGRIHRVIYEELVDDPEGEVKRLLEYCGLPFDERCLRFYENDRAVRTASSEQVRQPIFRSGLEQWKHFEPWLGPLREALGPVLEAYPGVPPEFSPEIRTSGRA